MAKLVFDEVGARYFETGVKNGVMYLQKDDGSYDVGVPWNGLTAVTESPGGGEATPLYADDIKYVTLRSAEEFSATVEAYTYPDEFAVCDGSASLSEGVTIGQQARRAFGLSYKTAVGNDIQGQDLGYKIHIIYGCTVAPSEKAYSTINDSPEAITFSWELSSTPAPVTGHNPTSTVVIDSTRVDAEKLAAIEAVLYGDDEKEATLPTPDELIDLLK